MNARPATKGPEPQRLQKLIAATGLTSRREAEEWVRDGRVRLNKRLAKIGDSATVGDVLTIDERRYQVIEQVDDDTEVLIYNKPEGEVTTRSDTEGRRTVFERLPPPHNGRWVAVGRLDINTSGLLLLTNDGELANKLMHPSSGIDREYACRVHGIATDEQLQTLRDGVELEDGPARFTDIVPGEINGSNQWFHVALMEGRNREVRRLWNSQGLEVSRLKRVRYGAVFMPKGMKRGHYEMMKLGDIRVLRQDIGMEPIPPGRLVLEAEQVNTGGRGRHKKPPANRGDQTPARRQTSGSGRNPASSGDKRRSGPRRASDSSAPARKGPSDRRSTSSKPGRGQPAANRGRSNTASPGSRPQRGGGKPGGRRS